MTEHRYSNRFFDYIVSGSTSSAKIIVPIVRDLLGVRSVLDVGCGRGAWLSVWEKAGVSDFLGIDGEDSQAEELIIPQSRFSAHDLTLPLRLHRSFDLVQCLEVAEHLPEAGADTLVDSLCRHGQTVLFSAATPGQGGESHLNEQPLDYWRGKFNAREFVAFDPLRPLVRRRREIEPWYRFNTLVYAKNDSEAAEKLSEYVAPRDLHVGFPLWWKLRLIPLRLFPHQVVTGLARVKHALLTR